jgi:hypothetical protein
MFFLDSPLLIVFYVRQYIFAFSAIIIGLFAFSSKYRDSICSIIKDTGGITNITTPLINGGIVVD